MRTNLAISLFVACISLHAAVARVAHTTAHYNGNSTVTSSAIDTTGASLLIVAVGDNWANTSGLTVTDSKGNAWHYSAGYTPGDPRHYVGVWYAWDHSGSALAVGSGHTVTVTGAWTVVVVFAAYSGTLTSGDPYDQHNGAVSSGANSLATGSVTPTVNGSLVFSASVSAGTGTFGINEALSIFASTGDSDEIYINCADRVQETGAAINPTWTDTAWSGNWSVAVYTFKPSVVAAAPRRHVRWIFQ